MRYEILRSGSKFFWRLVGSNGETLAHSETYRNRGDAERTALLAIEESADAQLLDRTSDHFAREREETSMVTPRVATRGDLEASAPTNGKKRRADAHR